jgi:hypothetical protein
MSETVWQLARAVVWATTCEEAAQAQDRLWEAVAPDMHLYHAAIWQAGLERAAYLHWERMHRTQSHESAA